MQNRGAIWTFTILLTVACLYQLSFSWVTKGLENKAVKHAKTEWDNVMNSGDEFVVLGRDTLSVRGVDGNVDEKTAQTAKTFYETSYVSEHADDPIYPVFGLTYRQCNDQKLGTGLDLQGGMSVTLEISIEELVLNKAGHSPKPAFRVPYAQALKEFGEGKSDDFIGLFEAAYNSSEYGNDQMTFFSVGDKENFSLENTNAQMIAKLRMLAAEAIDNTEKIIETRINRFGVSQPSIQKQPISGRLHIELPGAKDKERVRKLLQSRAELGFWLGNTGDISSSLLQLNEVLKNKENAEDVADAFDVEDLVQDTTKTEELASSSIDTTGVDTTKTTEDADLAALELEDEKVDSSATTENADIVSGPLFSLLKNINQGPITSYVGMAKAVDTAKINLMLNGEEARGLLPEGVFFRWSNSNNEGKGHTLYALEMTKNGNPLLNGDDISNAAQDYDQQESEVVVTVGMTAYGASEWESITTNNVGRITAIVLDNEVYSAPVINQPIAGGQTRISGDFTIPEAQDLATVLVAGSYDTPAKIVDEAVVGPTLGEANIKAGMWSFIAALILVLLYMVAYYGKAGVVASIALIANIFFLLGALASLGAQLTLPGIAGLVLTLGMSVDANVLIFERIREELREGKGVKLAIKDGYKHAYSAIIDANITSLLTAVVLAYFGTGPIQGFATTLIVGVFTSLFSSILLTRLIFSYLIDRNSNVTFSRSFSENMFANMNVDFVGKRKKFYLVSIAVVVLGIVSLVSIGLDKSVEFTGGRVYRVEFSGTAPGQDAIAAAVEKFSVEGDLTVKPDVKTINNEYTLELTTKYLYTDVSKDATKKVDSVMNLGFVDAGYVAEAEAGKETKNSYKVIQQRSVNAQISDELILGSFMAIIFSLIVIFAYIAFRFNRMTFGIGALIAMFHDVLVVLGLFSILYKIMPFSMQIDQAFIAAILTVVGYSINDTVVVFDRIREYIKLHRRDEQNAVINKALNSTLSRTLNTSLTTFLVLLVIFIFGGESIKGFSFALMIGVVVGTYSSIFIATPSVIDLSKGSLMPKKAEEK
ncbi:MAG: protein translocase subunit SecDF [Flavobacteriales bacterium]|jgi:SecD/SecF fusion protein|nr:protein translocase subunit SecDF [Flavobacteriales bacterium]